MKHFISFAYKINASLKNTFFKMKSQTRPNLVGSVYFNSQSSVQKKKPYSSIYTPSSEFESYAQINLKRDQSTHLC